MPSRRNWSRESGPSIGTLLPYFASQRVSQAGGTPRVIEMAVGQDYLFDLRPGLIDRGQDAIHVATGIDHHAGLAVVVPQDRTVLLEGSHGDDRAA